MVALNFVEMYLCNKSCLIGYLKEKNPFLSVKKVIAAIGQIIMNARMWLMLIKNVVVIKYFFSSLKYATKFFDRYAANDENKNAAVRIIGK